MAFTPTIGALSSGSGATQIYEPLKNENFAGVGGQMTSQAIISQLYTYTPFAISQVVHQRHSRVPVFKMLLGMLNGARGVAAPTIGHYEQDWMDNTLKFVTKTTDDPGAGNAVQVQLHNDSMYNAGATVGGSTATATYASYARPNDVILFSDGKQAVVTVKDTTSAASAPFSAARLNHLLTLVPVGNYSIHGSIDASTGNPAVIITNAFPEGSGLPEGVVPRIFRYTNTFMITKESFGATGSELTNQIYAQFKPGVDGSLAMHQAEEMIVRFEGRVSKGLLFSQSIGNTTNNLLFNNTWVGNNTPYTTTEGFLPFVENNGHEDAYTSGNYTLADFDTLATIAETERIGTRQLMTFDGFNVFKDTENALFGQLNNNLTPLLMKEMAASQGVPEMEFQPYKDSDFNFYVGFKAVEKAGYSFYFRQMHEFNEAVGAGAAGYNYNSRRYVAPVGLAMDSRERSTRAFIGYDYKALGGYKREAVSGVIAGAGVAGMNGYVSGGQAAHQYDTIQSYLISEYAFHGACPNQFIWQHV